MEILNKIKKSFFQNFYAIIFLQIVAVIILLLYYNTYFFPNFLNDIANLKEKIGVIFIMFTTGIAGGLFPELLNKIFKKNYFIDIKKTFMLFMFWFYKGFEIGLFYTILSKLIGADNSLTTVFKKIMIDEFIYTPFWAVPTMITYYAFIENNVLSYIKKKFVEDYLSILILNWIIWIPSVAVIYSLPLPLQMPIQNIILIIWGILIVFFAKN